MVDLRLTDQHDLGGEGDGLGVESRGSGHADLLGHVLDADAPVLQRAFQGIPGIRFGQHVARFENEETPVRGVKCPGFDHVEVGQQSSELSHVLNPADEVLQAGVALPDDGSARQVLVVDQHVHVVLAEGGFRGLPRRDRDSHEDGGGLLVGPLEVPRVLDHVLEHQVEVVRNLRYVRPLLSNLLDQVFVRRRS